jgi:hypothetical protein
VTARPAALLALVLLPLSSRADEALVKAQQHTQSGVAHVKAQRYADAVKEFEAAFSLKPVPQVAIQLGEARLLAGDKAGALQSFQLFLRIARLVDPQREVIEKRVAELQAEVPPAVDTDVEGDLAAPEPLPEDRMDGGKTRRAGPLPIAHAPAAEVKRGEPIPIVAEVPRAADAVLVWLYYRNAGESEFTRLGLERQGNADVTAIPGKDVYSSAVQYYIEARDGGGRVAAASGSESSPHLVVVQGGAAYARGKPRAVHMSKARKWFWGTLATAGALLAAGTVTAILAKDRESALEDRAAASRALGEEPGQSPALFDEEAVRLENEGQNFEAVSVLSFALGAAFLGTAGTLWYFDRPPAPPPPRTDRPRTHLTQNFSFLP